MSNEKTRQRTLPTGVSSHYSPQVRLKESISE
jgi:hypothetical protein